MPHKSLHAEEAPPGYFLFPDRIELVMKHEAYCMYAIYPLQWYRRQDILKEPLSGAGPKYTYTNLHPSHHKCSYYPPVAAALKDLVEQGKGCFFEIILVECKRD